MIRSANTGPGVLELRLLIAAVVQAGFFGSKASSDSISGMAFVMKSSTFCQSIVPA